MSGSRQRSQVSKTRSDNSRKATLNEHVIHCHRTPKKCSLEGNDSDCLPDDCLGYCGGASYGCEALVFEPGSKYLFPDEQMVVHRLLFCPLIYSIHTLNPLRWCRGHGALFAALPCLKRRKT